MCLRYNTRYRKMGSVNIVFYSGYVFNRVTGSFQGQKMIDVLGAVLIFLKLGSNIPLVPRFSNHIQNARNENPAPLGRSPEEGICQVSTKVWYIIALENDSRRREPFILNFSCPSSLTAEKRHRHIKKLKGKISTRKQFISNQPTARIINPNSV